MRLPDVAAAAGVSLVVASVDGGDDSYWHARADGTDAMAMLLDEFIPMVEGQLDGPLPRALLGWSMGGYGALLAAETEPERFKVVVAASPALWTSPGATAPGAFDSPADYHHFDVFAGAARLAGMVVRVDCGTGDPFYAADRHFVVGLPPGHQGGFGPGSHNATYWRSQAPAQIATIAGAVKRA
jgi:S-formylglutathione hydrolase FrmB